MQAYTHFLTGILIQLAFVLLFSFLLINTPFSAIILVLIIIFTLIFGFLSHALLDSFAKMTYHPPKALWDDWFWKIYHLITLIAAAVIVICFWPFLLGMFAAVIIDIVDWGVRELRKIPALHLQWYDRPILHEFFSDPVKKHVFGFLPNWNHERKGIVPEIILNAVQLGVILVMLILVVFYS
jgi:hypothetical protein